MRPHDGGSLFTAGEARREMGKDGADGVYEVILEAAELDA